MNFTENEVLLQKVDVKHHHPKITKSPCFCIQIQMSSHRSASFPEFCPTVLSKTSKHSHHASYMQETWHMPTVCTGVYISIDCVPVTLFEIRELWLASTDPTRPATSSKVAKSKLSSPIASSHKRARSVDTGRDMQQPGPPSKLSRSHSADNLAVRKADPPQVPPLSPMVPIWQTRLTMVIRQTQVPACLGGRRLAN